MVKGDIYVAKNTMNAIIKGLKGNGESQYTLTRRQREVLQLLSMNLNIAETAARLEGGDKKPVTPYVVNFHLQHIRRRLNSRTLHGTIAKAIREKHSYYHG
jgi:DNA-binding CsgD family transcriptional regulator